MQSTHSNSSFIFLVINIEVAKTATSFCFLGKFVSVVAFLFTNIVLNVIQIFSLIFVFLGNFNDIDFNG